MNITARIQQAFDEKVESGAYDEDLLRGAAVQALIDALKAQEDPEDDAPEEDDDEQGGGGGGGQDDDEQGGGGGGGQDDDEQDGDGDEQDNDDDQGQDRQDDGEQEPKQKEQKMDREACDDGEAPERVPEAMLAEMKDLNLVSFEKCISASMQEYLGLFKREAGALRCMAVEVAQGNKGSVSIPTRLINSEPTTEWVLTHNHPNSASFSQADFRYFASTRNIDQLRAVCVFATWSFARTEKGKGFIAPDHMIYDINERITKAVEAGLKAAEAQNPKLKEAAAAGAKSRSKFLNCSVEGSAILSRIVTEAWHTESDRHDWFSFIEKNVNESARGEFSTMRTSDVQALMRKITRRPSMSGLGDDDEKISAQASPAPAPEQRRQEPEPETAPMTTEEIMAQEDPETLPLEGTTKAFLSSLLANFNMLIWGGAGSGKSSFVLKFATDLAETDTGTVLYYMSEEKIASGRLKARMDLMRAFSRNINFDDTGTFDRLVALVNTGVYRYVVIDSINMMNVGQDELVKLMKTFPEISWIFVAQATKGRDAYAGVAAIDHAVDTVIHTTNDKGHATAELKKHRDGPLNIHTIFEDKTSGVRTKEWVPAWKA